MSEETDAPIGGADGVVAPDAVDTAAQQPSDDTTEQKTGADEAGLADETGEEPTKRKPWWEKRFDELTAKAYEKANEAAYWRGKAESAPAQTPAEQPKPLVRPTLEQFDYDDAAYGAAMDQYVEKRAEQAAERVLEQRSAATSHQTEIETAQSRLAEGARKHSDFTTVTENLPLTPAIRELLVNDEAAPDILYELGRNGDVDAFSRLTPYRQAVELGKIAARLSPVKPTSPKPIAPPPPETVAGLSAGLNKTLEQMSYAEFVAAREADEKNSR